MACAVSAAYLCEGATDIGLSGGLEARASATVWSHSQQRRSKPFAINDGDATTAVLDEALFL
jgi:hypothetical protein